LEGEKIKEREKAKKGKKKKKNQLINSKALRGERERE
jgi:hypothetical protein